MNEYKGGRRLSPPVPPPAPARPVYNAGPDGAWRTGGHGGWPAAPPPRPARGGRARRNRPGQQILVTLIAGMVGAVIVLLALPAAFGVNPYDLIRGKVREVETSRKAGPAEDVVETVSLPGNGLDVATIAKKVIPSIVNIDVQSRVQSFRGFSSGVQEGTGSGIIYSADGYIITNDHVVGDAQTITVTLASGEQLNAVRVGTDPESDVAVVKIEKTGLPAISLGDSDDLKVGQIAVAVGSPYGFEQSVTSGIISALHRSITVQDDIGGTVELTDLMQTDAAINPGNSGGALCDSKARLVGVATLIASSSGGSEGIGFAIPVNKAKTIADAMISGRPIHTVTQGQAPGTHACAGPPPCRASW